MRQFHAIKLKASPHSKSSALGIYRPLMIQLRQEETFRLTRQEREKRKSQNGFPFLRYKYQFVVHPIWGITHSTSCLMFPSKGNDSPLPNKGLGLFFMAAACEPTPIGDTGLLVEVKQLSTEQSPIRAGIVEAFLLSRAAASSDMDGIFMFSRGTIPWQSLETLMASSESSSLAASSPAATMAWSFRALQAFSSIDCRYLPCASIRSWSRRWTWWG